MIAGYEACLAKITEAAGRSLSDEEANTLLTQLDKRRKLLEADGVLGSEAAIKAADQVAKDIEQAAIIEKRNAALNYKSRLEITDFISRNFADNPSLGLEAALVGVNRVGKANRLSASAIQSQLEDAWAGGFYGDIRALGEDHWRAFTAGDLDQEIFRALWAKGATDPASVPVTWSKQGAAVADVVYKWQEATRLETNRSGAWIGKLPGYIVRQSHDMWRIRRAGRDEYINDLIQWMDPDKTLNGSDADTLKEFVQSFHDAVSSGVHIKVSESPTGFKGQRNLAKGLSQERVLHFKDADSASAYNQKYGAGNLREAILGSFRRNSKTAGLMQVFGPNAEANLGQIYDGLLRKHRNDAKTLDHLKSSRGRITDMFKTVDGSADIPGNEMAATVGSNLRAWQSMAKLGAALASQFSDLPTYASEMKYQGRGFLSSLGEAIGSLATRYNGTEKEAVLSSIGVVSDAMRGKLSQRIAGTDAPGGLGASMMQKFFKYNGMQWWTDHLRSSAALGMANHLGLIARHDWDGIGSEMQRILGQYGINADMWDVMRQAELKQADGRAYMVPEAIQKIDDSHFEALLNKQVVKVTPARLRDLKREVETKLRTYYNDRLTYAVVEPDARTRHFMYRGYQPGTVAGEALRFSGQFKGFTVAYTQKVIGRELYGRGSNTLLEAMKNGNGELFGLARIVAMTSLFGYASMATKDLIKGKTPRNPTDTATMIAAMTQGGGLGIFGDFLFAERSRFGRTLPETLAGPIFGAVGDIYDIYQRVKAGDDAAAKTFKTLIDNTPFANLFYARIVMNYAILYDIQEWLNPGSLRRMERNASKEGQDFLLKPTDRLRSVTR